MRPSAMAISCWILTDGRIGTENNARGLAEALGFTPEIHQIHLRQPWRALAPWLRLGLDYGVDLKAAPPWPDLLITAGRTPAVSSLFIGQRSPHTLRVHITNPGISPRYFNLLITPQHDRLKPHPNLVTTVGALHRITPAKLASAVEQWRHHWQHLPRPWHVVLLGGNTPQLALPPALLLSQLSHIRRQGGSIMATASRRTPVQSRQILEQHCDYLWDGTGDNPYFGLLAVADRLYVSADSISMLSEAASTPTPTSILPMHGHAPKHARFHAVLVAGGHACWLGQEASDGLKQPLNDFAALLPRVQQLLATAAKAPK